jgi:hypothetical protein
MTTTNYTGSTINLSSTKRSRLEKFSIVAATVDNLTIDYHISSISRPRGFPEILDLNPTNQWVVVKYMMDITKTFPDVDVASYQKFACSDLSLTVDFFVVRDAPNWLYTNITLDFYYYNVFMGSVGEFFVGWLRSSEARYFPIEEDRVLTLSRPLVLDKPVVMHTRRGEKLALTIRVMKCEDDIGRPIMVPFRLRETSVSFSHTDEILGE